MVSCGDGSLFPLRVYGNVVPVVPPFGNLTGSVLHVDFLAKKMTEVDKFCPVGW